MELIQDETRLTIATRHKHLWHLYVIIAILFLVGLCALVSGIQIISDTTTNQALDMLPPFLSFVIAFGTGVLAIRGSSLQDVIFDKISGTLTIITRALWRLWRPVTKTVPFEE